MSTKARRAIRCDSMGSRAEGVESRNCCTGGQPLPGELSATLCVKPWVVGDCAVGQRAPEYQGLEVLCRHPRKHERRFCTKAEAAVVGRISEHDTARRAQRAQLVQRSKAAASAIDTGEMATCPTTAPSRSATNETVSAPASRSARTMSCSLWLVCSASRKAAMVTASMEAVSAGASGRISTCEDVMGSGGQSRFQKIQKAGNP